VLVTIATPTGTRSFSHAFVLCFSVKLAQMIASQATQIIAAPFAVVGSIGVMLEGLNVHDALKSYGVKPLSLKAGDMKNPITTWGEISDRDLKLKLQDLNESHHDFIELCRSTRQELDPGVCNGRVMSGEKALQSGMTDRILTSEEYIYEKISEGDLVMKLHLISPESEQSRFLRVLQILPHLRQKLQSAVVFLSGGRFATFDGFKHAQLQMHTNLINDMIQGVALASMIYGAVIRSRFWKT
jgi:ClpP class serine protease